MDVKKAQMVPCFTYFGTMRQILIFSKIFNVSKGLPRQFFDILEQTGFPRFPPFAILKTF